MVRAVVVMVERIDLETVTVEKAMVVEERAAVEKAMVVVERAAVEKAMVVVEERVVEVVVRVEQDPLESSRIENLLSQAISLLDNT